MNNLQKLITEYAIDNNGLSNAIMLLIVGTILTIVILSSKLSTKKFVVSFFGVLFIVFFTICKINVNAKLLDKSTILKEDYNIEMKENNDKIEVSFNKKENSSDFFKDNFKATLEKTNEDKYYVYFDENKKDKKDKKEVSLNEIKETFGNIKRVETTKFSLSELEN